MDIAALIIWIITALGGFVLLGTWIQRGGLRQQQSGVSRLPAPVVLAHFLVAVVGLLLWIAFVASGTKALAWIDVALLVVIALLGFTMFVRWIPVRRGAAARVATPAGVTAAGATPAGAADAAVPAEAHLPVPVVAIHGLVAVTTLVLVVLAAIGV